MRKTILILLSFIISFSALSQQTTKEFYELKTQRYAKMKRNGLTMGAIGGVATTVGILFVNNADWEKETTGTSVNYNTNDPSGIGGVLLIGVGVPLVITGIILTAVGNKKEKAYREKLKNLSFNIKSTRQMTGLSLTYNF